jgi:uncharacterized protein (DUF1330 family)
MILITQIIYIKEGAELVFDQFEAIAMPLISKHRGRVLFRMRTAAAEMIEASIPRPYEIHLVEFEKEEDLQRFMGDEERKRFLHLKEQAIQSVILIKGEKINR